jgi:hypothetical protein
LTAGIKANVDGSAAIQVGGVDAITLTSAGAASFVTSPMTIQGGSASAPSLTFSGDTNTGIFSPAADTIAFSEGGVESMRIDASGNLLVGTTSSFNAKLNILTTGGDCITTRPSSNISYSAVSFQNSSGSFIGSVACSTTNTSYNTSSDYRLKEDIAPMTGALAKVQALKPVTYKWKIDGSDGEGFIAHELQEVCPEAVSGEKDAVNEDGSIKPQGIDTSFLVATLTAAIQELKAELDATKAEVALLKGAA